MLLYTRYYTHTSPKVQCYYRYCVPLSLKKHLLVTFFMILIYLLKSILQLLLMIQICAKNCNIPILYTNSKGIKNIIKFVLSQIN